jgi:hypothetical protein
MPIEFAQHAYCGEFHLETRYLGPQKWRWEVLKRKQKPGGSGTVATLDAAKEAAVAAAGVSADQAKWRDIGPRINADASTLRRLTLLSEHFMNSKNLRSCRSATR